MKIQFSAQFDRDWVMTKEHTMGVNPGVRLKERIKRLIGENGKIKMMDSGYAECKMMLFFDNMTFEAFEKKVWQFLEDEFQIGMGSKDCRISYEKILDEAEAEELKKREMLAAIKPKIQGLFGAKPYKELLSEIELTAPQYTSLGIQRVFNSRAYLFSVDEGCGLTTYLNCLVNMISCVGLFEFTQEYRIIEALVEKNDKDPWQQFNAIEKFKQKMICFDISQWIQDLDDPQFQRFLRRLRNIQKDYIFVFRVPYLEEPVLGKVYQALNDAIYTKVVSFPPFTYKEYFQYVSIPLGKYNFALDEDAREIFNHIVMEEKSRGSFYGLRTIRKIAYQMMHNKILRNAKEGTSDLNIGTLDLELYNQ